MKTTFKNQLVAAGVAGLMFSGVALADVSLRINVEGPPPPPRHEVVIESSRPGPDYVWIGGFWDGEPGHYTWSAGHWDHPPRAHSHWEAPHYEKDHDGHYHQVKGGWRD
jgi:hypothetical protein